MRSPSRTGKSFWRARERQVDGAGERVAPARACWKSVIIARPAGWRARRASAATAPGLGAGADPDEGGDQDQEGVAHQPEDAEADGEHLADAGGGAGGAHPVHAQARAAARSTRPPSIGKAGRRLKSAEHQVGREQRRQEPSRPEVER